MVQLRARPGLSLRSLLRWMSASKMLLPTRPQSRVNVSIGSQLPASVSLATVIVPAAPAGIDMSGGAESATAMQRIFHTAFMFLLLCHGHDGLEVSGAKLPHVLRRRRNARV